MGIGAFLLIAGILAMVWAPGAVKKTPLDVNTTTRLTGEAAKIDTSGEMVSKPIYAQNITRVDSEASTDDTAVWSQNSCVAFGAGGDCFAKDDPNKVIVPEDESGHRELVGLRHRPGLRRGTAGEQGCRRASPRPVAPRPRASSTSSPSTRRRRTTPTGTTPSARAWTRSSTASRSLRGHETYVFKVEVSKAPIEVAEDTPGTYSDTKEIYVDPATGSIINQTEQQQRWLDDGTQVLDLKIGFTDDQVKTNVDEAESNGRNLTLITTVVPLVGLIGGVVLVAAGLLLARLGGGARKRDDADRPLVSA
ncbi:DUF3068 domain-containing protein [Nocardioides sp. W3-2-3]|nr:DUF3068 domain-containing protein [Nocardioides convexus]